jgi:hypothetical protein
MNRILKRIGGKLRPGLSPDAPPLSSDAPPPDRMTDADYEAFQKARRMLGPWLGMIVAILALATAAPAHADGSTASLTDAARQVYTQVQPRCTPSMAPHFQRITTDGNGHGRIVDSNPSLGGPFDYLWGPNGSPGTPGFHYHMVPADDGNGIWYIARNFC